MNTTAGLRAALIISLFLALTACASAKIQEVWQDPGRQAGPMNKIMVVAAAKIPQRQAIFEDQFVKHLQGSRIKATACNSLLARGSKPTVDSILAAARKQGIDGILAVKLVAVDTRITQSQAPAHSGRYYDLRNFFPMVSSGRYGRGYHQKKRYWILRTNLYRTDTAKLVWSARTQSVDPETITQLADQLAPLIIGKLRGAKLLK